MFVFREYVAAGYPEIEEYRGLQQITLFFEPLIVESHGRRAIVVSIEFRIVRQIYAELRPKRLVAGLKFYVSA